MFSPINVHQTKRLASPWAYSTGRTKALTPNGENYIASHPLARKFDGQQLGPGSYHCPMSMSGRLRKSNFLGS